MMGEEQQTEKTLKFVSDLDKLIWAIKTTENKFEREGEYAVVDLAAYLNTGNLYAFTEESGARNLMSSVDYKKIREDVKIRIAENVLRALKNGVMSCPNNAIINSILKDVVYHFEMSRFGFVPFKLGDKLESLLNNEDFYYALSKAVTGDVIMQRFKYKNPDLPNAQNLDDEIFPLGDPNFTYFDKNIIGSKSDFNTMILGLSYEIEGMKYLYGKESIFGSNNKELELREMQQSEDLNSKIDESSDNYGGKKL